MSKIVFFSGLWNATVGGGLLLAAIEPRFGVPVPLFWGLALCGFIWFTAAVLIVASRDLPQRASFVYWQALLRFFSAAVLFTIGGEALGELPMWFMGSTDLAWGMIYVVGLRRTLHRSHAALLRDKVGSVRE